MEKHRGGSPAGKIYKRVHSVKTIWMFDKGLGQSGTMQSGEKGGGCESSELSKSGSDPEREIQKEK